MSESPTVSVEERRRDELPLTLRTVHGRVVASRRLTPSLVQVTLGGFAGHRLTGGDEFLYAMVSSAAGGIPAGFDMDDFREQGAGGPVRGAYYTVRRSRPSLGEIDIWAVDHGHPNSVSAWMIAAAPGEPIALWGPRRGFRVPDDARHVLLVADETGLAAVAAIVETLPGDRCVTAVLECVGADHRPPMPEHPGLTLHWVDRGADEPGTKNRLLEAVVRLANVSPDAAFGAAEARQVSAVRRHVRTTLGLPSSRVSTIGYWRREQP